MEQQQTSLVQGLYYYIQQRVTTDWMTDPGMAVLLTLVTCGIYGLYVFYKLMERRDLHLARMYNVAGTAIALLREKAQAMGKLDVVSQELAQLDNVQRQMYEQSKERGAALWLVLGILTGIAMYIGYYFIMDDFKNHDIAEAQFFTLMSGALAKLGLSSQPSQAMRSMPERNFVTFLLLSIVTCGIYYFYWLYVLVLDGNNHFEAQVQWEDFIYTALATS
ncbi:MAG: DUF4234 domain-containing protein [Actinobacteria bacterium]|nr:DUF4234 domain-containing protein [Actinomycetota bacterium]